MTASELRQVVKLYNAVVYGAEGLNLCARILDAESDNMVEFLEDVIQNAVECINIAYKEGLEYDNAQFLEALHVLTQKVEVNEIY